MQTRHSGLCRWKGHCLAQTAPELLGNLAVGSLSQSEGRDGLDEGAAQRQVCGLDGSAHDAARPVPSQL